MKHLPLLPSYGLLKTLKAIPDMFVQAAVLIFGCASMGLLLSDWTRGSLVPVATGGMIGALIWMMAALNYGQPATHSSRLCIDRCNIDRRRDT